MTNAQKQQAVLAKLNLSKSDYGKYSGRMFSVNGEDDCTMTEYLYTNLCESGVDHIPVREAKEVMKLEVGDTYFIEIGDVARTK